VLAYVVLECVDGLVHDAGQGRGARARVAAPDVAQHRAQRDERLVHQRQSE